MHKLMFVLVSAVAASLLLVASPAQASESNRGGAVYTLTNSTAGNAVAVFSRDGHGSLTAAGTFATGGNGSGGGLGSQGALALSAEGNWLFAVNAASNSLSILAVRPHGLELVSTVPSGGARPISLTVHGDLLYVLNAGAAGNISGFRVGRGGLTPLAGSTRPLGAGSAGPAQVSFSPDGATLVVTEKTSSTIDTYAVDGNGLAGPPTASASTGTTPFGFDFDKRGHLLVSEAATGSASSYSVGPGGVNVISGAVSTNGQAAPCWLVTSKNGRFAYLANAGSGTISGYSIAPDGSIALNDASGITANLGAGSHPLDEALTGNGRFLYNLTDGSHSITGFLIGENGNLTQIDAIGGLPAGAAGIIAS